VSVLIIGDTPGDSTDPLDALGTRTAGSGRRLRELMGLDEDSYQALQRVNAHHDGQESLTRESAQARLQRLLGELHRGSLVIVMGGAAQRTLGGDLVSGRPVVRDGLTILPIPHTSGRNRVWNDPLNRQSYQDLLRSELAKALPAQ